VAFLGFDQRDLVKKQGIEDFANLGDLQRKHAMRDVDCFGDVYDRGSAAAAPYQLLDLAGRRLIRDQCD